ncbi:hypothetical protein Bca52824_055599 [Brassica carinata]|nr:hypothetical protein Bca52824_055599 [Brassica carinata]
MSDDEWIKSHADLSNAYLMGTSAGDRQRGVANLFKEKGVDVVERFTDDGVYGAAELGDSSKSQALLASIRNFISSTAPLHFSLKSILLKEAKLLMTLKD